jgi:hypothetical protein
VDSPLSPCPTCDDVTDLVQPPCADGHTDDGGECPEWVCMDCGAAFVVGDVAPAADLVRARIAA